MSKNDFKIFNFLLLCLILIGLASAVQRIDIKFAPKPKKAEVVKEPVRLDYIPQFVLISFDGSKDVELWKDLRDFKKEMKRAGKDLNFTHFINTAYFLTNENRHVYTGPGHAPGQTDIGVSGGIDDIRKRIGEVNMAIRDGDEIAPHTTGHFSGRGWSKGDWQNELDSFSTLLFGLNTLYPDAKLPRLNLKREDLAGFRAPYLDISAGLYEALPELGYKYDTSEMSIGNEWPTKDARGLWHIPLGTLYLGEFRTPVLAMDYNLYVRHTNAADTMKKGTPAWEVAYKEMLEGWHEYFNRNYSGKRAPVLIGYHFGQWNDGVYWEVMKDFAREVCGKPEVRCGTFKELVKYMEEYGVPNKQ